MALVDSLEVHCDVSPRDNEPRVQHEERSPPTCSKELPHNFLNELWNVLLHEGKCVFTLQYSQF